MHRLYLVVLWLGLGTLCSAGTNDTFPAARGTNAFFLLGRLPPVEPVLTPPEEIDGAYGSFQHVPFEASGVNPMVLPFHDTTPPAESNTAATATHSPVPGSVEGTSPEALAFSALLSSALDWVPGNYCNRHAYFIFKRDRETMLRLAGSYGRGLIVSAMDGWKATHTVGGSLRRLGPGYAGSLVIYDRTGTPVLERQYKEARGYFDLLADVTIDAMGALGYAPPPMLRDHLRKPRCTDMASVADLGSSAFVELRSADEFRLYRRILARSPEFAEVRAWMATMGHWAGMQPAEVQQQGLRALADYPHPCALMIVAPRLASTPAAVTNVFLPTMEAVARMIGSDHQLFLMVKAMAVNQGGLPLDKPFLLELLRAAPKYPNESMLLNDLSTLMIWKSGGPNDAIPAMECAAAGRINRAIVNSSKQVTDQNIMIAHGFRAMGQAYRAIPYGFAVLQTDVTDYPDWLSWRADDLADWMEQAGHYDQAAEVYRFAAKHNADSKKRGKLQIQSALCGMIAGRPEAGYELLAQPGPDVANHPWLPLLKAYAGIASGQIPTNEELTAVNAIESESIYGTALYVQIKTAHGDIDYTRTPSRVYQPWGSFSIDPGDRRLWFLMDACERATSNPDWIRSFYDALPWLYGDDPWVRQTCAEWRRKHPGLGGTSPEEALHILRNYEPLPWPVVKSDSTKKSWWAMPRLEWKPLFLESGIRAAIEKGRYDQAEEIILRALHQTAVMQPRPPDGLLQHLNWVYHRVQMARKKAGLPPHGPAPSMSAAAPRA
jgi:hypothetical protein